MKRFLFSLTIIAMVVAPLRSQNVTDAGFRAFLAQFEDARTRFINGDARAWKELLSSQADTTLMSATGGFEKGGDVARRYEAASGRLTASGNKFQVEYIATGVSGDLAYAVTIERSVISGQAQQSAGTVEQRVTSIFRRENGSWKLLHRHIDELTQAPAPTSAVPTPTPAPPPAVVSTGVTLKYDAPVSFYRSASTPPEQYSSTTVNAGVQIYPFRPYTGDVVQSFQRTMLREWIDPQYVETQVVSPPQFARQQMAGANTVISARFRVPGTGGPVDRLRVLIVAGDKAALVDINANSQSSWQQIAPSMQAMMASMRVEATVQPVPLAPTSTTPGPGSAGRTVAGLYMALVYHPRPFTTSGLAAYYYLFSAEGRVYRHYDELSVPGGNPSRFDFDAAERADPVNSGRYSLEGNVLRIQMGAQRSEVITTTAPVGGRFKIGSAEFERQ